MDDPESESQGVKDVAIVLPFVALVLLMPPIILIFATPTSIAGIPLIVVFIFGVWALLVVGAFLVARRLERVEATDPASSRTRRGNT